MFDVQRSMLDVHLYELIIEDLVFIPGKIVVSMISYPNVAKLGELQSQGI